MVAFISSCSIGGTKSEYEITWTTYKATYKEESNILRLLKLERIKMRCITVNR